MVSIILVGFQNFSIGYVMIKYCNECKHFAYSEEAREGRCFNPIVNRNDYYMLGHKSGKGYGTYTMEQRRHKSLPWNTGYCGLQGKLWEPKA